MALPAPRAKEEERNNVFQNTEELATKMVIQIIRGSRSEKHATDDWKCNNCGNLNKKSHFLIFDLPAFHCRKCRIGFTGIIYFNLADVLVNGRSIIPDVKCQGDTYECVAFALAHAQEFNDIIENIIMNDNTAIEKTDPMVLADAYHNIFGEDEKFLGYHKMLYISQILKEYTRKIIKDPLGADVGEQKSLPETYFLQEEPDIPKDMNAKETGSDSIVGGVKASDDGKIILDIIDAIHAAEKKQADTDAYMYSEEKRKLMEKYEKELMDTRARELMYAEEAAILDKNMEKSGRVRKVSSRGSVRLPFPTPASSLLHSRSCYLPIATASDET